MTKMLPREAKNMTMIPIICFAVNFFLVSWPRYLEGFNKDPMTSLMGVTTISGRAIK